MIVTKEFSILTFKLSQINCAANDVVKIVLKNPLFEQHLNQNNMVIYGALQIQIDSYSEIAGAGQNAKFCPRKGLTPFPIDTFVTMTATEPTQYLCVIDTTNRTLGYEAVPYASWTSPVGCIAAPITPYTLNGVEYAAGTPYLTAQGDILTAPETATIGLFTPV